MKFVKSQVFRLQKSDCTGGAGEIATTIESVTY
jgi:hypothetical protein